MITNINPKPNPKVIDWPDFLALCNSCNLVANGPDSQDRYKFTFGETEVMHQVKRLKTGELRATGWFSCDFRDRSDQSGEFNGHKLSQAGQVAIVETVNPNAPMILAQQPQFSYLVGQVLINKMD